LFLRISPADVREKAMIKLKTSLCAALGLLFLGAGSQSASAKCQLNSPGGQIKHVVYIVFDNVHLRRDNPNVPSDLEQMPNLLGFLQGKGVISGNHYTPLISHTADDILTGLTGVYGDRHGSPVSNSFRIFLKDNSATVFQTSFVYWTTTTTQSNPSAGENLPVLVNEKGLNAPAPWPVYTRAGCDVGVFSLNGMAIENATDIANIFGSSSGAALQDYLGVAIHCAKDSSSLCNKPGATAKADALPDEPGGYAGFSGLFGNINVQPIISPGGPVTDLDGQVIYDSKSSNKPGFPIDFNPTATASLGYALQMLQAGVPVVYTYVADAHDPHRQNVKDAALSPPPNGGNAYGPGEAGYVAQLKAWDKAFGTFFSRLKGLNIDETNTLFVVVPDENDHFAGGPPTSACDGVNTPCTYTKVGEITTLLDRLVLTEKMNSTPFDLHSDDAPNLYIHGNPAPTDKVTRTMEHDLDALTATSPITGKTDKLSKLLADRAEMKLLHMVTFSPQRTPTITMFGDDDYFFQLGSLPLTGCATQSACVFESPGFAWNHGDFQKQITQTWVAFAGPGVRQLGRHDDQFTDHTDVRPTLMALLGLKDDYVHDGRVVAEWIREGALPDGISDARENFIELATAFKQLNAPKGELGRASLVWSNRSVTSDDKTYARYLKRIADVTEDRDELAAKIKTVLDNAAFHNKPVDEGAEDGLGRRARQMIDQVKDLADQDRD
jgi:arylsulfatase A-like enzyme